MPMVTLVDGRQVDCASEEHRHECEARYILNLPNKAARRCFLDGWTEYGPRGDVVRQHKGIRGHRGEAEVKRLEATILALWKMRRQAANDNEPKGE